MLTVTPKTVIGKSLSREASFSDISRTKVSPLKTAMRSEVTNNPTVVHCEAAVSIGTVTFPTSGSYDVRENAAAPSPIV